MKPYILSILIFLTINILLMFILWCTGFNFDHRDDGIAFWVASSLSLSSLVSITTFAQMKFP